MSRWLFNCNMLIIKSSILYGIHYTPRNEVVGGYTDFTMSVRLQTNPMSYDNLSCVTQNLLKFYQLFTGEKRRIPFIFDDFRFCRSRVIGLDYDGKQDFYPMSYANLSSVSQNVLKFDQQLTSEERRIPFIFDDFHYCRSRVIGLDMMENRIFTLCRMIT